MKSKLTAALVVFSILIGFTVAFAQTASTVTADQLKAALDKFTAARTEYQTLVKNGADKASIEAAYAKFTAARAEYQQLNKAAGNCDISGKQTNKNGGGQGNGLKKRDGSCGISGSAQGTMQGTGSMQGRGKGRGRK